MNKLVCLSGWFMCEVENKQTNKQTQTVQKTACPPNCTNNRLPIKTVQEKQAASPHFTKNRLNPHCTKNRLHPRPHCTKNRLPPPTVKKKQTTPPKLYNEQASHPNRTKQICRAHSEHLVRNGVQSDIFFEKISFY